MSKPERCLRADASFFMLLFLALLSAPPLVTAAVLLAATLHELGHLAALRAFGVPVRGLRLSAWGAVLYAPGTCRLSYGRELLVTLAGPAVNLLCAPALAFLAVRTRWEPGFLLAGAHAVLGVYNLLPIAPLDGGTAVYLITAFLFGPTVGDAVCAASGMTCALILFAIGAYLSLGCGCGFLFLLAATGLLAGSCAQLGLAKTALNV